MNHHMISVNLVLTGLDDDDAEEVAENAKKYLVLNIASVLEQHGVDADDLEKYFFAYISVTKPVELGVPS